MIEQIRLFANSFFLFDEKNPINFTDDMFWIFFTLVFGVFTVLYKQYNIRNLFLFLASTFFYYKTSGTFFVLLLFTITNEFFIAAAIHKSKNEIKRKIMLTYSLLVNLGLLAYFKYAYFFTDSYNKLVHSNYEVVNVFA